MIKFLSFLVGITGVGLTGSWAGFHFGNPDHGLDWLHQGINSVKENNQKSKGLIIKIPLKETLDCSNNKETTKCREVDEGMKVITDAFKKGNEKNTLGSSYNWDKTQSIENSNCSVKHIQPNSLLDAGLWELAKLLLTRHCIHSYGENQQNEFKKFLEKISLNEGEKIQDKKLVGAIINNDVNIIEGTNWTLTNNNANDQLQGWKDIVNKINSNLKGDLKIQLKESKTHDGDGWSYIKI